MNLFLIIRLWRHRPIYCISIACAMLIGVLNLTGCAAYRFGTEGLYPPHVQTVYVPVFKSENLRPGMGAWLTEAVVKKIEQNTNYKVVGPENADTVLEGTVLPITKAVSVTTINDDLREVDMTVQLAVRWLDNQGDVVHPGASIPLPVAVGDVTGAASQVTEVGHSTLSTEQEAIEQVASQIVALMETPW
ncbi:MAG: hypothetical protein CMJ74_12565 [Planctomycetaceae bacterium]|nr:hypothetical protein [Planctomycetaceae bacterium]|tara:strand:- start:1501 stop:2070 length:570 start_codon:yes stop_codon:yes gene_type:complete